MTQQEAQPAKAPEITPPEKESLKKVQVAASGDSDRIAKELPEGKVPSSDIVVAQQVRARLLGLQTPGGQQTYKDRFTEMVNQNLSTLADPSKPTPEQVKQAQMNAAIAVEKELQSALQGNPDTSALAEQIRDFSPISGLEKISDLVDATTTPSSPDQAPAVKVAENDPTMGQDGAATDAQAAQQAGKEAAMRAIQDAKTPADGLKALAGLAEEGGLGANREALVKALDLDLIFKDNDAFQRDLKAMVEPKIQGLQAALDRELDQEIARGTLKAEDKPKALQQRLRDALNVEGDALSDGIIEVGLKFVAQKLGDPNVPQKEKDALLAGPFAQEALKIIKEIQADPKQTLKELAPDDPGIKDVVKAIEAHDLEGVKKAFNSDDFKKWWKEKPAFIKFSVYAALLALILGSFGF